MGEAGAHLALGSSYQGNSTTRPHQVTPHRIGCGRFVLIRHFLDSFIFPFSCTLSLETSDCALSNIPHHSHSLSLLSPEKKLQATTLFSSHLRHILKILFCRFLLVSNWLKFCHSEVPAFKTKRGLISPNLLSCPKHPSVHSLLTKGVTHPQAGTWLAESTCGNF